MREEFFGELTGARFRWDSSRPLAVAGWGRRYEGHVIEPGAASVDEGDVVLVHAIDTLDPNLRPELERARRAIEVARRPAIAGCMTIVRFLDLTEAHLPADDFNDRAWDTLRSAWEYGELWLPDVLSRYAEGERGRLAAEVESGVAAALACLHDEGLVHSDVAPNNVVRVGDVWKLIDLDHTVMEGEKVTGVAKEPYGLPGIKIGDPARHEMDLHGLDALLATIRGESPAAP